MYTPPRKARDRETRTDPKLIASIVDHGDRTAWNDFESWYGPIIRAFCASRGLPGQDIDDVTQDVYLRISQSTISHRYDPERGRFRSYLFRVTRSAIADRYAKKRDTPARDESAARDPRDEWEELWKREALKRAIEVAEQTASAQARQILNFSLRGNSPRAIADTLGLSIEAVYKARQRLRGTIEEHRDRLLADE